MSKLIWYNKMTLLNISSSINMSCFQVNLFMKVSLSDQSSQGLITFISFTISSWFNALVKIFKSSITPFNKISVKYVPLPIKAEFL